MNYIKYGLSLFLAIVLIFNLTQKNVYVAEGADTETLVDNEETVEADFADDCVLVVLTNEASLAVDQYDTSTFAGINCSGIQSLTQAKETKIQEKISTISANLGEIATTANVMKIATTDEEISNYKQRYILQLAMGYRQDQFAVSLVHHHWLIISESGGH